MSILEQDLEDHLYSSSENRIIDNDIHIDRIEFKQKCIRNDPSISKYYWKILLIISSFYILPSLQFVMFQKSEKNVQCFYNLKCKHDFMKIPAFNNVISNSGYIFFGILFFIIVYFNRRYEDGYGLHTDISLYISLSVALVMEGLFSGMYHVCPSILNFQFDTTYMFIGTALSFITLYQKRHPGFLPGAFRSYLFLAFIIFLNILPLSGISNGLEIWFWVIIIGTILFITTSGSIFFYYGKGTEYQFCDIKRLIKIMIQCKCSDLPRFFLILVANIFTYSMVFYGIFTKPKFTEWMLGIFIMNLLIYFIYYLSSKYYNGEKCGYKWFISLFINIIEIIVALILFEIPVSNKLLPIDESNRLNKPCTMFDYFDTHDMWHFMSAIGLFHALLNIFLLDQDLNYNKRENIAIF